MSLTERSRERLGGPCDGGSRRPRRPRVSRVLKRARTLRLGPRVGIWKTTRARLVERSPAATRALPGDDVREVYACDLERIDDRGLDLEGLPLVPEFVADDLDPDDSSRIVDLANAVELQLRARLGTLDALGMARMMVGAVAYALTDVEDATARQRVAQRVHVVPEPLADDYKRPSTWSDRLRISFNCCSQQSSSCSSLG